MINHCIGVKKINPGNILFLNLEDPVFNYYKEKEIKKDILKNYYRNIFYNDIVPRFDIKKSQLAEKLLYYLLSNPATLSSYNNLSKIISLADKTIKEYTGYFSQSLLLFWVDRFSASVGKQIRSPKKVYAMDNGLVSAIAFKIFDNLAPLFDKSNPCLEVFYI